MVRSSRRSRIVVALVVAVTAISAGLETRPTAHAATGYYVSPTGSDSGSGTASSPWRTIQRAVNAAPSGSAIYLRAGTYAGATIKRPYLTLVAYNGEPVTIKGDAVRWGAIIISDTHHVTLSRFTVTGTARQYGAGVRVERSNAIVLDRLQLLSNRSFGAMVSESTNVTIRSSRISLNETGIQFSYAGGGSRVEHNTISDNNRMIVNDATAWNDRGANGVVFYRTTGPIGVRHNRLWGHRAPSHDYGYDGGAFEVYAASNITIAHNVMSNNQNTIETGTDGPSCSNITFARNTVRGGNHGERASQGLVLRCASNSLVANNTFVGLTDFVYYLQGGGGFAGSLSGLRIRNNISSQTGAKVYSIDSGIAADIVIDNELVWQPGGQSIAWVRDRGNTASLSTFRSWTGWVTNGWQADPRFIDGEYRLGSSSPAIDRGALLGSITSSYKGAAPDLGRYER